MQHHTTQAELEKLAAGDEVELVREPGNQYDKNAVQAHRLGRQIGFVPAADAKAIAPRMDIGWRARGEVTGFQRGSEPRYWRIGMRIKLWPPATRPAEGATS